VPLFTSSVQSVPVNAGLPVSECVSSGIHMLQTEIDVSDTFREIKKDVVKPRYLATIKYK